MAFRAQSAADLKAPTVRTVLFDVTETGLAIFRGPETRFGERVGDLGDVSGEIPRCVDRLVNYFSRTFGAGVHFAEAFGAI